MTATRMYDVDAIREWRREVSVTILQLRAEGRCETLCGHEILELAVILCGWSGLDRFRSECPRPSRGQSPRREGLAESRGISVQKTTTAAARGATAPVTSPRASASSRSRPDREADRDDRQ